MKLSNHCLLKVAISIALFILALGGASAAADSKELGKKKPKERLPQAKEERVEITGSHLKRKITRNGRITDGQAPLFIIDRKQIEQSGASTVAGVLKRQGMFR
jgi:hypothetical protein